MKRRIALGVTLLALSGCQGQTPPGIDPFFGRTRVPPPGTGGISGAPGTPYYGGAPYSGAPNTAPPYSGAPGTAPPYSGGNTTAPPYTAPQTAPGTSTQPFTPGSPQNGASSGSSTPSSAPGGGRTYPQDGTQDYRGTSWTRPGDPVASRKGTTPGRPASGGRSDGRGRAAADRPTGREPIVQVLQPRPSGADRREQEAGSPHPARTSDDGEPRRLRATESPVEITQLPRAGRLASAPAAGRGGAAHSARPVSAATAVEDRAAVAPAVGSSVPASQGVAAAGFAPPDRYGYDPDYRWLRGKLDYSQIDRRWKLRYIPIDGRTDQFGGSVVLADEQALAGCERGQFIEVRGRVSRDAPTRGFAPVYEVAEVQRLDRSGG